MLGTVPERKCFLASRSLSGIACFLDSLTNFWYMCKKEKLDIAQYWRSLTPHVYWCVFLPLDPVHTQNVHEKQGVTQRCILKSKIFKVRFDKFPISIANNNHV